MARWIKIHDKILEWEWYSDANVLQVFLYLLLNANPQDKRYKGKIIKRGQTLTSFYAIADMIGIDVRSVRKSIVKLESTGEIKVERHSGRYGYSIITICKYSDYQDKGANNVPLDVPLSVPLDVPLSVPNNRIEEYKNNTTTITTACEKIDRVAFLLQTDQLYMEQVAMAIGKPVAEINKVFPVWVAECRAEDPECTKTLKEARQHFKNYARIYLNKQSKSSNNQSSTIHFQGERKTQLRIS